MPIHDWGLVDAGIFHDFHLSWIGAMKAVLNARILPTPYYALAESVLGDAIPEVLALEAAWARPAGAPDAPGLSSEEEPGRAVALASRVVVQDLRSADPHSLLARAGLPPARAVRAPPARGDLRRGVRRPRLSLPGRPGTDADPLRHHFVRSSSSSRARSSPSRYQV